MPFSPLTSYVQLTSDSQPRTRRIDMFILHHAATTSLSAILSLFQPGGRTVSANYAMGNDGTLVGTVDESRRAWTSASWFDDRAVTIEVANESTNGWTISGKSHEALSQLAADLHRRYGLPLDRDHIIGHRELYARWGESYPTECPGSMNLDAIVRRAREIIAGGNTPAPTPNGDPMPEYAEFTDPRRNRKVKNGAWTFVHKDSKAGTSFVTGRVRGTAIVNLNITGLKPGGAVQVRLQAAKVGSKAAPGEAVGKNGCLGYMDAVEIVGTGGSTLGQAVFTFDLNGPTDALRVVVAPVDGDVTIVKAKTTVTYWKK